MEKGGVGKSSICVNLAYSLQRYETKVGLFDADLSGPSIPTMVHGVEEAPQQMVGVSVLPGTYGGIRVSSLGFNDNVVDSAFWTGRYLRGALYQLVLSFDWMVDILLVDLPPGIGELHQELFSCLPGRVVLVTTPQEVSYADVSRSIDFVRRLDMEIIGVVENMSYYTCSTCATKVKIFSGDTEEALCRKYGIDLLAQLPIIPALNESMNRGMPFVLTNVSPDYDTLSTRIVDRLSQTIYRDTAS